MMAADFPLALMPCVCGGWCQRPPPGAKQNSMHLCYLLDLCSSQLFESLARIFGGFSLFRCSRHRECFLAAENTLESVD